MNFKNVGGADRWARVAAGGLLLAAGLRRGRAWPLLLAGGVQLLRTAATQYCPLSKKLGFNTYQQPDRKVLNSGKPMVQEASEESFPASDAPAWTGGVS